MLIGFVNLLYLYCLLVSDLKKRIAFLVLILSATFLAFLSIVSRSGFVLNVSPAALAISLNFFLASMIAHCIIFSMILKIKGIAQMDLNLEVIWQERVRRLEEVSSMTKAMRNLLIRPIEAFSRNLIRLRQDPDGFEVVALQKQLDELVLISKAFGWIFRAHSGEESLSITSSAFMSQLEALLSIRAQEKGWALRIEHKGQSIEISGPVPAIMYFLYSISVQIFGEAPYENRQLSMEFEHRENSVTWKVSWPLSTQGFSVAPLQELIRDLMKAGNASIQRSRNRSAHQLLVSGPRLPSCQ